jgi:hypothetical protein
MERKITDEAIQCLQMFSIVTNAPLVLVLFQKLRRDRAERMIRPRSASGQEARDPEEQL